ncbi:MAG: ABC transporter substrate-binding protein [Gordonia sp. (in: high G+C Gram-positive bacteria)]|uniref:ABC transporter substrate-binding protein n=1 Tax=Gordonia sp. (in: high G+C Gram-positive bacteria) TaxID=84139 RepID=UPI0039E5173B
MATSPHLRRRVRMAAALLAAGTLLTTTAACSSDSDETGGNPAVPCASGDLSGERTVKGTYLGDVKVPAAPKRIISGWLVATQLIDLGVVPVGMLDDYKANATPDELKQVEGVPDIGSATAGVNTEKVLSLNPDLVVTYIRKDMEKTLALKEVNEVAAPTVALEIQEPTQVWDNYQNVADAIGCGDFAKKRLAGVNDKLTAIANDQKDALGKLGTAAYIGAGQEPGTFAAATNKSLVYKRLEMAGVKYFDGVPAEPKRFNEVMSLEQLNKLSSANVIFFDADTEGKPAKGVQELLDNPAFKALPAVQKGNVYPYRTAYSYTTAAVERQAVDIAAAVKAAKPAQ